MPGKSGSKTSNSSKKAASKSRPSSTSQLNAPANPSTSSTQNVLCAFSPFNDWFACLTQAVDRHRLQIYSCDTSNRLVADYIIPNARCRCLEWVLLPTTSAPTSSQSSSSKKRRKRQSEEGMNGSVQDVDEQQSSIPQTVLAIGLSSSSIHLFNPLQGKVIRILSLSSSSTSAASSNGPSSLAYDKLNTLFACNEDGTVLNWSLSDVVASDPTTPVLPLQKLTDLAESSTPFRQVAALSSDNIILAHHSIAIYSTLQNAVLATYTGHASNVTHLVPLVNRSDRFVSAAEGDRVVNLWQAPEQGRKTARPLATLPLDAPVAHVSASSDESDRDRLLVVTVKGSVRLYEVPADLEGSLSKGKKSVGIVTLPLLSHIRLLMKVTDKEDVPALDAKLDNSSSLTIARMAKGAKVAFETAAVQDNSGSYRGQVTVLQTKTVGLDGEQSEHLGGSTSTHRYSEAGTSVAQRNAQVSTLAGANGLLTGPEDVDLLDDNAANVDVDPEAAEEPSLGQRLKGIQLGNGHVAQSGEEGSDDEDEEARAALPLGSLSLGQTLTQALHSNDAALLSSCLAHSDPAVIRSSVARLSGPLAVKLLEHCVDRMGRGGKRSSGALGSARTRGIIEWVRVTLTAHTGYLMSLPHLVHRLSALHATLSSRLASHERLLALNGRLELVLGQIEMRAAYTAEQAQKVQGVKSKARASKTNSAEARRKQTEGKQWVEESSSEEENAEDGMDVDEADDDDDDDLSSDGLDDVVRGEEEGIVQDIALGNDTVGNTSVDSEQDADLEGEEMSEDDEEEGEGESDEDEEDASDESALDEEGDSDDVDVNDDEDDSDENATRGGLLDVEAESTDGDEDGSDESEE